MSLPPKRPAPGWPVDQRALGNEQRHIWPPGSLGVGPGSGMLGLLCLDSEGGLLLPRELGVRSGGRGGLGVGG